MTVGNDVREKLKLVIRSFWLAVGALTIFPARPAGDWPGEKELAASRFAFPVVGLLLGALLAGVSSALRIMHAGPAISAAILVAASVVATRCLHLDGVADTCDGLFMVRGDRQRRLEAMRDPHVGSLGATAIALLLMIKFAALVTLAGHGRSTAILAAMTASRTLLLTVAGLSGPARPDGVGRFFLLATTKRDALIGAALVVGIGLLVPQPNGLAASTLALAVALWVAGIATARLGGITGDILGAAVELGEAAFLSTLALSVQG